jgi:hypothetical protein
MQVGRVQAYGFAVACLGQAEHDCHSCQAGAVGQQYVENEGQAVVNSRCRQEGASQAEQAWREARNGERLNSCAGWKCQSQAEHGWSVPDMQACRCLPVSEEKRLSTRPAGVASKKAMGRASTAASSCSCTRCEQADRWAGRG